ncbi:MAG: hypothetical protein HZB14_01550 [Actinobacteria bacterium]|nr:hypothetical protein [Actinomycetota bacterium]
MAIFGVENDGIGMVLNLLIIFLVALDIALVFWTWNDARRRLTDPVLVGSAVLSAVIFPFAGALVYMIVRPPETLEDAYERDLDIRAAELRVRLLEQAVKGGPGSAAQKAAIAGEMTGEPPARGGSEPSRRSPEPSKRPAAGPQSPGGARRAEATNPTAAQQRASARAAEKAPTRPSQSPQRPASGRPPAAGADGA